LVRGKQPYRRSPGRSKGGTGGGAGTGAREHDNRASVVRETDILGKQELRYSVGVGFRSSKRQGGGAGGARGLTDFGGIGFGGKTRPIWWAVGRGGGRGGFFPGGPWRGTFGLGRRVPLPEDGRIPRRTARGGLGGWKTPRRQSVRKGGGFLVDGATKLPGGATRGGTFHGTTAVELFRNHHKFLGSCDRFVGEGFFTPGPKKKNPKKSGSIVVQSPRAPWSHARVRAHGPPGPGLGPSETRVPWPKWGRGPRQWGRDKKTWAAHGGLLVLTTTKLKFSGPGRGAAASEEKRNLRTPKGRGTRSGRHPPGGFGRQVGAGDARGGGDRRNGKLMTGGQGTGLLASAFPQPPPLGPNRGGKHCWGGRGGTWGGPLTHERGRSRSWGADPPKRFGPGLVGVNATGPRAAIGGRCFSWAGGTDGANIHSPQVLLKPNGV